MKKRIISLWLTVVLVLTMLPLGGLSAFAATSGDFEYTVLSETDKTCEITKYKGSAKNLDIPSKIDAYTVKKIGEGAFQDCTSFTSITIPDSITIIGPRAFQNCDNLIDVEFPDNLMEIHYEAFYSCDKLNNIKFSNHVYYIGDAAFCHCESLSNIILPDSEFSMQISACAFHDTGYFNTESNWEEGILYIGNYLIKGDNISINNVSIKEGTKTIAAEAFESCDLLTSLRIPDSVECIDDSAFKDCSALKDVVIGNSVWRIANGAFTNCKSLENVIMSASVKDIWPEAFLNCSSLTKVVIPANVRSLGGWSFGYYTDSVGRRKPIDDFKIYGTMGTSAETYAYENNFAFIDISTGTAATAPLAQNEISLSLFDKDTFIEGNVDFFGEHSASAQHRLNGVRLTAGSTQQDFDNTAVLKAAQRGETVVLSKNGYLKYTIPAEVVGSWFESDALAARNIYMTKDKKDGKPYISGAYAKENGKSVAYTDLQSESLTVMADTAYDILLTAETNGEAVQEYVLSQDDAHKLTSKNGVFSAKTLSKAFAAGKVVYAYVKTASGKTSAPVKVGLQITQLSLNTDTFSLVGQKGQNLTFAKDAPLVGNASLSLDGFTFPLGLEVEGNRFKISFGIDLFSVKKENDQLWGEKDGTKTWDFFKTNVRDLTSSVDSGTEKLKKFNNFYKTLAPNQSYNNKSQNFDTSFLGYAEGYLVDGKLVYTDFCGEVAAKFSFNYTQQGTIWVIPVYAYVKAGASAAIQLQSVRTLPDNDVPFDFGINLNITPSLTLGGGVGVKGAVSGGLYGKGSLPVAIQFMQQHANVKLTGEIGIEGECFCFSGKKTLLDGTITLYDDYYGKAKTTALQNVLQRTLQTSTVRQDTTAQDGTVTNVMPRDYAENTSRWLGNDYLKKFFSAKSSVADGLTVKELQTSVFKNSQTQLIALNDGTMLAAWIEDDNSRDTYNRMRLVYSVYENGSWSQPKAVSDDGTNDAYPSLSTDGKTVYIAWQNLKRTLTAKDADSIDAVLQNSEICIAKYDASKNVFANEKALTNNAKYDYSPSLAVENEQAVLYWQQSAGNDLSAVGSNSIYRYTTSTDTTTQVQSGLNYMSDMACAFVNGKDEVAFSMDADGNLSTTEDIYAYTISNGVLTQQTPSNETQKSADFAVSYGKIDGQNTLFFADSTDIYYKQNGEAKKVFSSAHTVNGDLQVLENGVKTDLLWTEVSESGTEIWLCSYSEGSWSEPVQISNIGALLHDVSAVYQNGVIRGIFDRTARMQENDTYVSGQTDFCYMTLADFADLEVSLITVDEADFSVGETAKIPVYLKNNGTEDISEVEIRITDTLGTNQTAHFSVDLPSGSETFIDVSYLVPQNYGETTLTVGAIVPNTEEINTVNNSDSLEIGTTDIALSEITVNDIGEYFVLSSVLKNRNPIVAKQVQVKVFSDIEKDKLLELVPLGDLQAGEMRTIQYIVEKSAIQYDEDNLAKICFAAESASKEAMTENNKSYAILNCSEEVNSGISLGDVNGDGEVTLVDYAMLKDFAVGALTPTEDDLKCGDVNFDGAIDMFDAAILNLVLNGFMTLPGDLTGDGAVTQEDIDLIKNASVGECELSECEYLAADVNGDGAVDAFDVSVLNRRLYCNT